MSLTLALNNALSGLRINQQSIGVLSNNIANVNTTGYSRQIVNQSALIIDGVGSGVKMDEITRKIDKYLQRSLQAQTSNYLGARTIDNYYTRVQALLGQPGSNNSVDAFLTTYFNTMQLLAESPETNSLKSSAVASASNLARQISGLAANINDLRLEADREIADAVNAVNSALDRLKSINVALTQAKSLNQNSTGLLDQRDKELRTISEYLNISTSFSDAGSATVVGGDGIVLLEEGVRHQLRYTRAESVNVFLENASLSALTVVTINDSNQEIGVPVQLISGGASSEVTSSVLGGKIAGLQQMRDEKFPAILDQLDMLASRIRDNVNALHNNGSGYPPATSLTGDRAFRPSDQYSWSGQVRIAVLQSNGRPVPSSYSDETYTGIRPLTLDLSRLSSGQGDGKPTMQTIIDEINNHFGAPGNKAKLGNINNIQLVSDTSLLPSGAPSLFNFDLDIDNISADNADIFVTDVVVLDDVGTNITSITQTAPSIAISPVGSYTTTAASADVTINLMDSPGVSVGDTIYLEAPSGPVNGIPAANLAGFFTVTATTGTTVTFTAASAATATGSVNDPSGMEMFPPYDTINAGEKGRTRDNGELQLDFSGNPGSDYYDVTVNVSVVDGDGVVHSAPITYRVTNNIRDIYNSRYDAQSVGGAATLVIPSDSQGSLRAIMVDADGNELPKVNGKYVDGEGYLKIIGGNSGIEYGVAIDELDSMQLGKPDDIPPELGTNRAFSHYFGLNNFFDANEPTLTGETLRNSAYNLRVQSRLLANANLISTGNLALQSASPDTNNLEVYTYARYSGDNAVAQRIAKLNTQLISFEAAGGLPTTQQSLQSYTSDLIGYVSQRSAEATDNADNSEVLYEGFKSKSDAVSGVNLDEELANTVVFQNAYSATARIVTVVNKMYEDLLQVF